MAKIKKVIARQIYDSRGIPTVEADVVLDDGSVGRAAVPSGASTGAHEALELRDGAPAHLGKGVLKAVANADKIGKKITGMPVDALPLIDEKMIIRDGTPAKSNLGANAILAVSMATARAGAAVRNLPLYKHLRNIYGIRDKEYIIPVPMLNIVNGGKHADSGIDVQEFMIVPAGAKTFKDAMRLSAEVYQHLKKLLAGGGYSVAVGDEGGFAPKIKKHSDVLKTICAAIGKEGKQAKLISIALDCAASSFYGNGKYIFEKKPLSYRDMTAVYADWAKRFPIISIEDPLAEDDWDGWAHLTSKIGKKTRVVGDDIFVTNPARLARGIKEKSANSILIKLNQIGTVSETVEVVKTAKKNGFSTIISHRSGETEDNFIADFAVAVNAGAIKSGAPCRSERLSKYNQLIRIEEELGGKAVFAGYSQFKK